jgi:pimeloyl-ACP methyl ester carboxylesterase
MAETYTLPPGINRAPVGDVELAYQTFGSPEHPPLLLVMGLGTQMLGWPDEFCERLADRGYFVIRFDNRDIGLSTHFHEAGTPDLMAAFAGRGSAPYTLSDMAADAAGLLEALGIERAHVVGASMGGMIAQTLAIEHPDRVRSLTSIMSTTGDRAVGAATEAATAVLLAPPATTREEAMNRAVSTYRVIGSPGYELDEAALRERAGEAFARAHDPAGVARQLAAILTTADRTPRLRDLRAPTLVIHGAEDPLVHVSGGRATAEAIPDAELVVLDGMGHDLPRGLWPEIVERITAHAAKADAEG